MLRSRARSARRLWKTKAGRYFIEKKNGHLYELVPYDSGYNEITVRRRPDLEVKWAYWINRPL